MKRTLWATIPAALALGLTAQTAQAGDDGCCDYDPPRVELYVSRTYTPVYDCPKPGCRTQIRLSRGRYVYAACWNGWEGWCEIRSRFFTYMFVPRYALDGAYGGHGYKSYGYNHYPDKGSYYPDKGGYYPEKGGYYPDRGGYPYKGGGYKSGPYKESAYGHSPYKDSGYKYDSYDEGGYKQGPYNDGRAKYGSYRETGYRSGGYDDGKYGRRETRYNSAPYEAGNGGEESYDRD